MRTSIPVFDFEEEDDVLRSFGEVEDLDLLGS